MSSRSRDSVRQAWIDRVDRFQQSNLSVAEFCSAENIHRRRFISGVGNSATLRHQLCRAARVCAC